MFNGLRAEIIRLNSDVKNIANSEKAKKLRKKLMAIGLPMMIGGFVGVFACFVAFVLGGYNAVESANFGFPTGVLVPFFLIMPFAIVGGIGTVLFRLALTIIITGYATGLAEEVVGNTCQKCGKALGKDELYCSKCGAPATKQCTACGNQNDLKNVYCFKCGKKL